MKQLTITIPDNKYPFFIELLKNLDFVDFEKDIYIEPTKNEPMKNEIKENIKQGYKKPKFIDKGKKK